MSAKLAKLEKLARKGQISRLSSVTFHVPQGRNITNFGPAAANAEHRRIISDLVLYSRTADEMLWDLLSNTMCSYGIELEIFGETYNSRGIKLHPYLSKVRTPTAFGGKAIWAQMRDTIEHFNTIKVDYKGLGYKTTDNRLLLTRIVVHPFIQVHRGGAGGVRKKGPEPFMLAGKIWVTDTPVKINYGDLKAGEDPMTNNNCAFRALHYQSQDKKWFAQNFPLKTVRKEFGLPPNCKLSPDELFKICDSRGVHLTITVVRGTNAENAEISTKTTAGTGHSKYHYKLVLHADTEHYYSQAPGRIKAYGSTAKCEICGDPVHSKDAIRHEFFHKLRHEFKPPFEIPQGTVFPMEGETATEFSERYKKTFVDIMLKFYNDSNDEEILAFLGPGGCGKSMVINTFRELYKDINVVCLSKTGVASQNIHGITYDSFLIQLRSIKELPDLIIIDEISFLSDFELNKLDETLRRMTNKAKPMGGIKTLFMGDFLQLLPYGKQTSCAFSPLFQYHVRSVPMLYGFRYKSDPEFYKLLLQFRSGGVHLADFMKANFGMMTRRQWITGFRPENRPTLLVNKNEDRRELEAQARAHDLLTYTDLREYNITLQINKIEPDKGGSPLGKDERTLTGSSKGRVIFNVPNPHHKASFNIALTNKEFDCEINADKTSFYTGERLMTLKNKCDDQGLLMNGTEVIFHSIRTEGDQEFMVVRTNDGQLCSIPKVVRGCKYDGSFFICEGFPVQSAIASTVHKAQGKTYSSIVIDVPAPNKNKAHAHLYYVALSRCTTSRAVSFMIRDKSYDSVEEGLKLVHDRFYCKNDKCQQLVAHNVVLVRIMKYTETGGPMSLCPDLDQFQDIRDCIVFPGSGDATYWQPKVSNRAKDDDEHRRMLFANIIFYDIETGAAVYHENHKDCYDSITGEFIGSDNKMRHDQTPWLVSFLHIKNQKIVWLREEADRVAQPEDKELLLALSKYQNDKGIVHIHLDHDDNDYCSTMFALYLVLEAQRVEEYKEDLLRYIKATNSKAHLSRYDRLPCTVVGFNSDSFDVKAIIHALDQANVPLPEGYTRNIIRNSGTSITRLSIVNENWYNIGDLIATHDLFRYHGCQGGLSSYHKTYMSSPFGTDKDKYMDFCSKYTYDTTLLTNLAEHLILGKSEFPHLLTQRKGYEPTLSNNLITYDLSDYPEKMRDAVQSEESRTFRMYDKSHEYMDGDIYVLVGAYIGANESNIECGLRVPMLSLNTAQQQTVANYLYTGSEIKGLITPMKVDKYSEKITFTTKFSLPNALVQSIIDKATYGGKTLPRVIEWNAKDGSGSYNQVDESGMYADAQEKKNYPYGPHYYSTSKKLCEHVMETFRNLKHGDQMNDPNGEKLKLPCMFIAEVTLKIPSLCVDPYIPFINTLGQLDWGICNLDTEDGTRRQWLTSIHLGLLKNMGGDLLDVHGVVLWEEYGPVYKTYLEELNEIKYTTKDPVRKLDAKLKANANYGASLKRDKETVTMTLYDLNDWDESMKKLDPNKPYDSMYLPNNTIVVQGHLRADLREFSSRPTYLGSFVLAHSQYKLGMMAMIGAGNTYIPKTLAQARESVINQPLYGDTDSLFIHETYIERLLRHAEEGGVRYLYDTSLIKDPKNVTTKEKLDKLGKYCDEVANDYGSGHMVNYKEGVYTKVLLFGSGGPKAYGALLQTPNGQVIPKNRIKGVKDGAYLFYVSDDGSNKRGSDGEPVIFSKKSEVVTRLICDAVASETSFLSTKASRTLKTFGFIPQRHERSVNNMGETKSREPWTFSVTNVHRDVLRSIMTRRRRLTLEEVSYLGLGAYDARRILVPNGWNWDNSLFTLT